MKTYPFQFRNAILTVAVVLLQACARPDTTVVPPESAWPQAERLFALATQAHDEYQVAFRTATFSDADKKESAQVWMRSQDFSFEYLRILNMKVQRDRKLDDLLSLVAGVRGFVEVPSYTFSEYRDGKSNPVVSLAKLTELDNEVNVASTALLRDIK